MANLRMEHVGIVVEDLGAAKDFFLELGFESQGAGSVEGEWVDRIVGLKGIRSDFAMLDAPDGSGRIELVKFRSPKGPDADRPAPANVPGFRHLALEVDDIDTALESLKPQGGEIIGHVESYPPYRLAYIRGPEGIIIELIDRKPRP